MEKLVKIAEITANNETQLNKVIKTLTNQGFEIVYDGEYDYTAYICERVEA